MDLSFCHQLPKIELHAHLNGSITLETLKELHALKERNNSGQPNGWDSSEVMKDSYSLNSFFASFKQTYALTSTPEAVSIATERVIEDFAKDNVIYVELRSTLRKEATMTKRQYLEAVISGIVNCMDKFPNISVKLIVSINRSESLEGAEENVKLAVEYLRQYPSIIVGIDVGGNPKSNKFSDYVKMLELARGKGLKVTVHCAEVEGHEEIKQILQFHPDRIGHGTCIPKSHGGDSELWKLLLEKKIPVEICLTSNIKCHTVDSFKNHHFHILHAAKHPLAICTDDKGSFNTTLSEEFRIVQKTFNFSEEELWNLSYRSIDYIFGDENKKESLRTILMQWKIDISTIATHFPQDRKNMKSMRPAPRGSASSAEKVLPVMDDTLPGTISEGGDYQHTEQKHCPEMSAPLSHPKNPCQQSLPAPAHAAGKASLVKSTPRSFWFNKLLFSLLGFCAPISYIPECGQECKPIMLCLPGPPEIAGKKEEKEEEELKPIGLITRNKEADFIGGKFIAGCTCGRKNGLQGDCPRISCRNNPGCTMNPPRCWPQFKVKPKPIPPPDQKMVCVPIQLVYYDPYNC